MKVKFKELLKPQISRLPKMGGVKLTFTLFLGSQRSADMNNIISIVEKFFCDALVELERLPDDSIDYITSTDNRFGGVDKTNPRVEITLEPTEIVEDQNMKITIDQNEIEQAITDYIKSQITINDNQKINIDLKATRGDTGFQALIDISAEKEVVEETAAPRTRKARTPKEETQQAGTGTLQVDSALKTAEEPVRSVAETTVDNSAEVADNAGEAAVADAPVEADSPVAEATEAPTAEEAGVPAFLQKKSIFGNN